MGILKDSKFTMDALDGKTVAILGYGNQGGCKRSTCATAASTQTSATARTNTASSQ
tara:strand:- start:956 stop:1123 length:168 start_codon:yes stop_codon:yes gene_type:complete